MSDCTQDCSSCGESCGERTSPQSFLAPPNALSSIKKVIAVVSGKGGVGKSLVTSSLAVAMRRMGKRVGILDADITGPSIPTAFHLHERAVGTDAGIEPCLTRTGIEVISLNLLVARETDPVVWRGPVIAGTVKQFWTDVVWGDLDYLFIDMPPGTGDVPLTVFQSLPVDGIIVVTSPQDLVSMIVTKAVNMANLMDIPVLGMVENYSYFRCPDCGKRHAVFGESHIDDVALDLGLPVLARLPIDPAVAAACDAGEIEDFEPNYLADLALQLEQQ
ncbi:MAG TPA: Mrp/NBP35 family ATP-binding protein [Pseudoflavonifractor sp.]|nr:Mrp/NBP35 family ATP-binding protein [Pseudoflavonifractor sp.]